MKFIILNYTYGNGPLARCLDILYSSIKLINGEHQIGIIIPEYKLTSPKILIIKKFLNDIKSEKIFVEIFLCRQLSK